MTAVASALLLGVVVVVEGVVAAASLGFWLATGDDDGIIIWVFSLLQCLFYNQSALFLIRSVVLLVDKFN